MADIKAYIEREGEQKPLKYCQLSLPVKHNLCNLSQLLKSRSTTGKNPPQASVSINVAKT